MPTLRHHGGPPSSDPLGLKFLGARVEPFDLLLDSLDNPTNLLLYKTAIVSLSHYPNQWLSSRGANQ